MLFFPRGISRELIGEVRYVPQRKDREEAIRLVVKELFLGPAEYQNTLLVPRGSKLKAVILRDKKLYLDLSKSVILGHEDQSSYVDKVYNGIEKTVRFNFPSVKEIVITIEGQTPFERPYGS
ncbi:GerMN domain-containing protein [Spirochaeta cellobiosiphila]|uniref:GerMN domain-containing protein n=1 Tax=Spirochaeta cellobiosiphila TaxID=504483 RepID=UPI00048F6C90|nr:GerMN domain-containing protein [Spirochaeta cellobiosiphila]